MPRRLLNFVTLLSLMLSAASAVMWVRSQFVTDGWEFKPRSNAPTDSQNRWHTYRLVESCRGRLLYAEYDWYNHSHISVPLSITAGYRKSTGPILPAWLLNPPGITPGRIPGVAEWYSVPRSAFVSSFFTTGRQRYLAVSWPAAALAGAILPDGLAGTQWRQWRRRRASVPGFPVNQGWVSDC